jgi:hypothetical protein
VRGKIILIRPHHHVLDRSSLCHESKHICYCSSSVFRIRELHKVENLLHGFVLNSADFSFFTINLIIVYLLFI